MSEWFSRFYDSIRFAPQALFNGFKQTGHQWLPQLFGPVCPHVGDILCHSSNGLIRLDNLLSENAMAKLDWCHENRYPIITSLMAVGAGLAVLNYYCCKTKPAQKRTNAHVYQRTPKKKRCCC